MGVLSILLEWFGVNVVVSGIFDFILLKEGSWFIFLSGVVLLCEGENDLCIQLGEVIQFYYLDKLKLVLVFVCYVLGIRGIVCIVERFGVVYVGDEIDVYFYQWKVKL